MVVQKTIIAMGVKAIVMETQNTQCNLTQELRHRML